MGGQINPKIVGATVIGFALVAGAYTVSNFGESNFPQQPASIQVGASAPRVAIAVSDNDNNGIEDWRDSFVTAEPAPVTQVSSGTAYTLPETVTGTMAIGMFSDLIESKLYAPIGPTKEQIISDALKPLSKIGEGKYYEKSDVSVLEEWDDQDIVNYANTAAATIYRNSVPSLDDELEIFNDIVKLGNTERMGELEALRDVYKAYRDDTLKIPVPALLAKEHLDLINSYQAIYEDLNGMTMAFSDPVVTLVHLKRYIGDSQGTAVALQNMYMALEDFAGLFSQEDPALLFALFSPDYKPNN